MLSIEEINNLEQENKKLQNLVDLQTKQYNSLLNRYNELMEITKTFWDKLTRSKNFEESFKTL